MITRRNLGAVGWWLLGTTAILAGGAAVGYKVFFGRAGEAAISYLPADAQVVLTVDLTPSPQQATTFEQIRQALKQEGLLDELEKGLAANLDKNKLISDLRPHIKNNVAAAMWGIEPGKDSKNVVLLLAVDDPVAVKNALGKELRAYKLENEDAYVIDKEGTACVIGSYLTIASNEESLKQVIATKNGKGKSVAQLPEYLDARKALPQDANAMLFISSSALKEAGKEAQQQFAVANPFANAGWFSMGLTVRAEGLLCSVRSPFDSTRMPEAAALAKLPNLNLKALSLMPAGAYGVAALSQPAAIFRTIQAFARKDSKSLGEMEDGLAKMRKETGFDLERDVLPAFDGEITAALYPGPDDKDPDALFVIDNSNGATPAEFAEKFRAAAASGRFDKDGKHAKIADESYGGADIHWLDLSDDPSAKGKTPGYAIVNGSVIAGTSHDLIREAIRTAKGGGNELGSDPRYAKMLKKNVKDARFAIMIDLPRLLIAATAKSNGPNWDWNRFFGDDGVAFSASYDGKKAVAELFIPVNWTEAIHRVGQQARADKSRTGAASDSFEVH
jgi:hypothetical protein